MTTPKRALLLAIALAFAGAAGAQRVTTATTSPPATSAGTATLNTTRAIPAPTTTAPPPAGGAATVTSNGTGTSTSGGAGSSGTASGAANPGTAADMSTLPPSNLTSGTANTLPTGGDNSATTTATTPAPFDSGTGTVLGAPVVGAPVPAEDYVIGPNGERIPVNRTATAPANPETPQSLAASRALDARLDRAARETRERVARKGQVLNSIAPRTDVDRTDQMPDDSTPLLSPSRR